MPNHVIGQRGHGAVEKFYFTGPCEARCAYAFAHPMPSPVSGREGSESSPDVVDVVIVARALRVRAARTLLDAGVKSFVVLEARARIGGRIHTETFPRRGQHQCM